jgi:uncharacterized protein YkwD
VSAATAAIDHLAMRSRSRALLLLTLATVLVGALAPAASAAVFMPGDDLVAQAERDALTLTNKKRTDRGLVALRWDTRLGALARQRAEYMATTGTFSHTQDGKNVFDMMTKAGITWYGGGEIIAWNTAADLAHSAAFAVQGWMDSPGHKAIMLSTDYNYVAFGFAVSPTSGKRYWAGVYMKGPDRTAAWVKIAKVSKSVVSSTSMKVTVTWSGGDSRLQVLTSGLRYYQMQKRRVGGEWYTYDPQTSTTLSRGWARGSTWEFRIRARDKAGNWGPWVTTTVTT